MQRAQRALLASKVLKLIALTAFTMITLLYVDEKLPCYTQESAIHKFFGCVREHLYSMSMREEGWQEHETEELEFGEEMEDLGKENNYD